MRAGILLFFVLVAGCGSANHRAPATAYETSAYANPYLPGAAPVSTSMPVDPLALAAAPLPTMPSDPRAPVFAIDSSNVTLTTARRLGLPTEEIGPIQEVGAAEPDAAGALRARARAIGADAVVGIELDVDPATHLTRMSGTAVRIVPLH